MNGEVKSFCENSKKNIFFEGGGGGRGRVGVGGRGARSGVGMGEVG